MKVSNIHVDNVIGGRIRYFIENWKHITNDVNILNIVKGYQIEFSGLPVQYTARETRLCKHEGEILDEEIIKLMNKGVIEMTSHCTGEFISTVFLRPKKTGGHRMILNLSDLNLSVEYNHFKMERLEAACRLMTKGCFMASIDLSDAYYSVNICKNDRKYLRFIWRGQLYQFTACPNGLSSAPRLFTKLMKPAYYYLRSKGFLSVAYIDDCYLQGMTYEDCRENVEVTHKLFTDLGFLVHPDKSVFMPQHELVFLGFLLNSLTMTISLTPEKINNFLEVEKQFKPANKYTIRQVAKLVDMLIAYSVANLH